MTTWAKNQSEFLAFLNGFDSRDAFAKSQRFPPISPIEAAGSDAAGKPPLEAQNDVLALGYEILGVLRKQVTGDTPSAGDLLNDPQADRLFSKATQAMIADAGSGDLLQKAVKGLVTQAYIEQIRREFIGELARSLKVFQTRLAKDRAKDDDWRDEVDGGVVLYDVFRPNLWNIYRKLWDEWKKDMVRVCDLATHLQRIDETLQNKEKDS